MFSNESQFGEFPQPTPEPVPLGSSMRAAARFTVFGTETDVDPDDVFFSVKTPAPVLTTYEYGVDAEVVKDSVGHYHIDLNANEVGVWYVRPFSEGNGQAADEESFTVADAEAV